MSQSSRMLVAREIKQILGGAFFLIHPVFLHASFIFFFSHERFLDKLALLQIKLIGAYKGNYTLSELHISISARQHAKILVHYKDGKRLESFSNHIEGRRLRIE